MASISCSLPSVLATFLPVAPDNEESEVSLPLDVVFRSDRGLRLAALSSSRLNFRRTRWCMPSLFLLLRMLFGVPSAEESDVIEPRRSSKVPEFSEDGKLSWLLYLRSAAMMCRCCWWCGEMVREI